VGVNGVPADYAHNFVISRVPETTTNVLRPQGLLEGSTYLRLRNAIISAAIDNPDGVIVDVNSLAVPQSSALAVFTSAAWHIGRWPAAPLALVCTDGDVGDAIAREGISERVPVFESISEAAIMLRRQSSRNVRLRTRAELPRETSCIHESRELMAAWLTAWSRRELVSIAKLVVTVFVENVLAHTESAPLVRLEDFDGVVTVAVGDHSSALATRSERCSGFGADISGISIVAALCREWGNAPTSSGKVVWATIGPENAL
jgi:hypothetical protein